MSYGQRPRRFPPPNGRQFQYSRLRSSIGCVTVRCRPWCIRSTLFMHSTALLARTVCRRTSRTLRYDSPSRLQTSGKTPSEPGAPHDPQPANVPSCGHRGRCRRSHHRRTNASRNSARGAASSTVVASGPGTSACHPPAGTPYLAPIRPQALSRPGNLRPRPRPDRSTGRPDETLECRRDCSQPASAASYCFKAPSAFVHAVAAGGHAARSPVCAGLLHPAVRRLRLAPTRFDRVHACSRPARLPASYGRHPGRSPAGCAASLRCCWTDAMPGL